MQKHVHVSYCRVSKKYNFVIGIHSQVSYKQKLQTLPSPYNIGKIENKLFSFSVYSIRSGVGVTGAKQTMFYAEVSDDNCVSAGGGEPREGELIEVVKVPLHEAMTFAYDERIPKTMGVIFSFIWFHNNMSPKYKISTNV